MRVGMIVYGLDRPLTGIGRYTVELVRAMAALADAPEIILLSAGSTQRLAAEHLPQVPLAGCRLLPGLLTLGNIEIAALARRLHLDIVHDSSGIAPFALGGGGAKVVVTVHDVIPLSFPGVSSRLDTLIHRYWLPRALSRVDAVSTISDCSARDITRYLRVPPTRLHVIRAGVGNRFHPVPLEQAQGIVAERFGVRSRYALFVGALTERKNIRRAVEAFALVSRDMPDLQLVVAGPRAAWMQTPVAALAQSLEIDDLVVITGPVIEKDLPALYSAAAVFLFPSLYEGFGLPPLEALACGAPVVCSDRGALPESVGDAALTVDPYDVAGIAAAMRRLLTDDRLRAELRERGLRRAQELTYTRAASETVALYRRLLHDRTGG